MSNLAFSEVVVLIINVLHKSVGNKKLVLLRLLELYRLKISDGDVYDLIDHYKRNPVVIETVFLSGALSEEAAFRMLKLFPRNKRLRHIAQMTYVSMSDEEFMDNIIAHEKMIDGRTVYQSKN